MNYEDPCGCLLHRALARKTGAEVVVKHGQVLIDLYWYRYSERKHEKLLEAAHRDPSLLPITITLR